MIPSYRGDLSARSLGITLLHEHVFVGDPELERALPHPEWDEQRAIDRAVAELDALHALGVETIVDLTVPGLGRNVARVAAVAARTRMQIVAATGFYTGDVLPHELRLHGPGRLVDGPDPLVELFVSDLRTGIAGTAVRAGAIKVRSDGDDLTPDVRRVFDAAAIAHRETGAPLMTHSDPDSRGGLAQQRALAERGVDLARVVIGHAGDATDASYVRELAANGSLVGFDRFGMAHMRGDEDRIRLLLDLLDDGLVEQIVLSHDAAVFSRVTPPSWRAAHAPQWRMDHLFRNVLPVLRARGVDDAMIDTMLVHTPRRVLFPEGPRS